MKHLRFGMVGGGIGSFIGDVHHRGAQMDDLAIMTAGCFSRHAEKNQATGEQWHIPSDRLYTDYKEMSRKRVPARMGLTLSSLRRRTRRIFRLPRHFWSTAFMCPATSRWQ